MKMKQPQWMEFPKNTPFFKDEYLVEDHEGNVSLALWDGARFSDGIFPFGYVKKWKAYSKYVRHLGIQYGVLSGSEFYSFAEMYDLEPLFADGLI